MSLPPLPPTLLALPWHLRQRIEEHAAAVREAALEEAAKVCEMEQVNKSPDNFPAQQFDGACRHCAAAIRALSSKE